MIIWLKNQRKVRYRTFQLRDRRVGLDVNEIAPAVNRHVSGETRQTLHLVRLRELVARACAETVVVRHGFLICSSLVTLEPHISFISQRLPNPHDYLVAKRVYTEHHVLLEIAYFMILDLDITIQGSIILGSSPLGVSVHGERANFTGLVLGYIEANF